VRRRSIDPRKQNLLLSRFLELLERRWERTLLPGAGQQTDGGRDERGQWLIAGRGHENSISNSGSSDANRRQPYDVTPDGKRFLVDTQTSDQTSALLNVVENWAEEFRKK
jgi:hypothetical protein